jgi:carotenoid cleavage dioxygenase
LTFGLLPRRNPKPEDIKWFYGPKNHGWVHVSNHFEDNGKFYFDLFFTDGDGLSSFVDAHPELRSSNTNRIVGKLVRFTVDPKAESNKLDLPQVLSHVNGEMARIDDRYVGKPYRHTWGVIWGSGLWDGIVHVDTHTGVSKVWQAATPSWSTSLVSFPGAKRHPRAMATWCVWRETRAMRSPT